MSESFAKENGKSVVGISETQLKQLLSLLNDKGVESSSQAHAVTKPGLPKIASRSWIIVSGATGHISSSSQSFFQRDNNCSLPPVLLPSGETTSGGATMGIKGAIAPLIFFFNIFYIRILI